MRRELVDRLMDGLIDLRKRLSEEKGCTAAENPDCSAIMLGLLIREQHKLRQLNPPVVAPYDGHSIMDLLGLVAAFPKSRPLMKVKRSYGDHNDVEKHCSCTLSSRLDTLLAGISRDMVHYDLTD